MIGVANRLCPDLTVGVADALHALAHIAATGSAQRFGTGARARGRRLAARAGIVHAECFRRIGGAVGVVVALHAPVRRGVAHANSCVTSTIRVARAFHARARVGPAHWQGWVPGRAAIGRCTRRAAAHAGVRSSTDGPAGILAVRMHKAFHTLVGRQVAERRDHAAIRPTIPAAVASAIHPAICAARAVVVGQAGHALSAGLVAHRCAAVLDAALVFGRLAPDAQIARAHRFGRVGRAFAALHTGHTPAGRGIANAGSAAAVTLASTLAVGRAPGALIAQANGFCWVSRAFTAFHTDHAPAASGVADAGGNAASVRPTHSVSAVHLAHWKAGT